MTRLVTALLLAVWMPLQGLAFVQRTPSFGLSTTSSASTTTSLSALKIMERKNRADNGRKPSRVQDPDGPTPDLTTEEVEVIDPEEIPELRDVRNMDELPTPIPHQPWRRGDTAGCDDPIATEWRQDAEGVISKAVSLVGGRVLDVTWYLTQVVVTLDEEMQPIQDYLKSKGPVIRIVDPSEPRYYDPNDPTPDEIWDDEDDVLYQRETEEDTAANANLKNNMYATKDLDDPVDEPHIPDAMETDDIPLYMNEETRDDMALMVTEEEQERNEESEKPIDLDTITIDTAALSTMAKAIMDALEGVEGTLRVLERHELILTSPGPSDVLETQKQFNAYRDHDVIVETEDPFNSNRTLKGRLVDRNSMDVIINKKGRMVTIPLNFVKCVRLPASKREKNVGDDGPAE